MTFGFFFYHLNNNIQFPFFHEKTWQEIAIRKLDIRNQEASKLINYFLNLNNVSYIYKRWIEICLFLTIVICFAGCAGVAVGYPLDTVKVPLIFYLISTTKAKFHFVYWTELTMGSLNGDRFGYRRKIWEILPIAALFTACRPLCNKSRYVLNK